MSKLKILITGATGFIGRHLTARLIKEGHDIICCGRSLSKLAPFADRVKAIYMDIDDKETIARIFSQERPQIVFHCAALVESNSLPRLLQSNKEGTRNVLDACIHEGIDRVVYLSSIAVVSGNTEAPLTDDMPYKATNPYGESKIEAEKIAFDYRNRGLKISIIRPCMVYGEDEPHLLPLMVKLMKLRLLPLVGEAGSKLQLVDVENVVDVMMLGLSEEKAYEGTYIIADKEALSVKELFYYIVKVLELKPPFHIPGFFIPLLLRLPFIGRKFSLFTKDRTYSIKNLKEKLNYIPRVSVYDGIKKAVLGCRR